MTSLFRKLTGRRKKSKPTTSTEIHCSDIATKSSHTLDLDATKLVNRPLHMQHQRSINEKTETLRRSRSNSNDPSKTSISSGTAGNKIDDTTTTITTSGIDVVPQRNGVSGTLPAGVVEHTNLDSWAVNMRSLSSEEGKHRKSRFSYSKQDSRSSNIQSSGSATYDSEDETAATTSTATAPLRRGRKPHIQEIRESVENPRAPEVKEKFRSPQTRVVRVVNRSKQVIMEPTLDKLPESALSPPGPSLPTPKGKVPPDASPEDITKQLAQNKETERIARAAAALDNRGNDYFERGYYDKAMDAYTRALKLKRRTFHSMLEEADGIFNEAVENEKIDRDDRDIDPNLLVSMATSINNIGYLRQRAGEATPDETMAAYKKSLRIKRKILGNDSLSVGKTLNNIGSVYYLKKEFDGALPAYEEALAIMQANLGDSHPDVATVVSNLGDVLLAMNKQEESLARYRTALNIRWGAFGEKDPRTMRLLEKIARIEIGDKMPTPRGITLMDRHIYDWDESELYDLDLRPISHELRLLKDQVKEDLATVDLLEKKIAVGMVRDKLRIVRGMRELSEAQERGNASGGILEGSSHGDDSTRSADDALFSTVMPPVVANIPIAGDVAVKNRGDIQARVRERLIKLRLDNGLPVDGPFASSSAVENSTTVIQNKESGPEPSKFLRSALYSTFQQPNRAALSLLKPEEIKEQADGIESALKLKKGIDNLRTPVEPAEKRLTKSSETSVHNLVKEPEEVVEVENPIDETAEEKAHCTVTNITTQDAGDEPVEKEWERAHDRVEDVEIPKDKLEVTKLMHATWLGEIAG